MATSSRSLSPPHSRSPANSDELVLFQRPKVVVHLLPGDADPRRQRGGRGGLGQFGKQSAADGIEGTDRRGGIGDDLDVEHSCIVSLTSLFVKARGYVDDMELLPLRGRLAVSGRSARVWAPWTARCSRPSRSRRVHCWTPTMPRLSRAADHSKLWLAHRGGAGGVRAARRLSAGLRAGCSPWR